MCYMQTEGIEIDKHFRKNLGHFTDGLGSDGSVAIWCRTIQVAVFAARYILIQPQTLDCHETWTLVNV